MKTPCRASAAAFALSAARLNRSNVGCSVMMLKSPHQFAPGLDIEVLSAPLNLPPTKR